MTSQLVTALEALRQAIPLAAPEDIPEAIGQVAAVGALLQQRLLAPPPPTVEEGAELPPILLASDIAKDLNLRVLRGPRKGQYSTKAVHDLASRRATPDLPKLPRMSGHIFRVAKSDYLAWRRRYTESGRV